MNRRGFFLAEETMKILLAVICLVFLVFILGKMYYSYAFNKDLQQAKDTLGRIEIEINSMKAGDPAREVVIYGPAPSTIDILNYWLIIGFSGQDMPAFCSEKKWDNCLCFCPNLLKPWTNIKEKCNADGTCIYFSGQKLSIQQVDLKDIPLTILVKKDSGTISLSRK